MTGGPLEPIITYGPVERLMVQKSGLILVIVTIVNDVLRDVELFSVKVRVDARVRGTKTSIRIPMMAIIEILVIPYLLLRSGGGWHSGRRLGM